MTCTHATAVNPPPPAPPTARLASPVVTHLSLQSPDHSRLPPSHPPPTPVPYLQDGASGEKSGSDDEEDGSIEEGGSGEDRSSSDQVDVGMEVRSCHPTCMHGSCLPNRAPNHTPHPLAHALSTYIAYITVSQVDDRGSGFEARAESAPAEAAPDAASVEVSVPAPAPDAAEVRSAAHPTQSSPSQPSQPTPSRTPTRCQPNSLPSPLNSHGT